MGASLGVDKDLSVTYARGKSREAMGVASGKIARLRAARVSAPAAAMEAFTDAERASLTD